MTSLASILLATFVLAAAAACAARAEVVSLDGTWQAEVAQDAQFVLDGSPLTRWESLPGDKKPWVEIDLGEEREVRECKIRWFRAWKKPPAKWRVSPALPARTRYVLIEIDDVSPNKLASIEEVELH